MSISIINTSKRPAAGSHCRLSPNGCRLSPLQPPMHHKCSCSHAYPILEAPNFPGSCTWRCSHTWVPVHCACRAAGLKTSGLRLF